MGVQVQIDEKSVDNLIKQLRKLPLALQNDVRKKILKKAAQPLIISARAKVKDSDRPHHRYSGGKKIATYHPGNLRRSIGIIPLRKSVNIYVGPRTKRGASGVYSAGRHDGYYGAFREFGTRKSAAKPFLRPAYEETKGIVLKIIADGCKAAIDKHISTHGSGR
jgi:HK97 gp10 family phage protein